MNKKIIIVITIFMLFLVGIGILFIRQTDRNTSPDDSIPAITKDPNDNNNEGDITMHEITMTIGTTSYKVELEDNETAKEFYEMLPLEIEMNELNRNEKYDYLDKSLPSNPSRVGEIIEGDIMLYGNNCLVLFYESFTTSYSYTRIGKITNTDSLLENVGIGSVKVVIAKES